MALSMDDRLLGEKVDNYCSSSEDEAEVDESEPAPNTAPQPELDQYQGFSTNTGPKGVINDWRRFKQLENEKRADQEKERVELMKKLSITCRTDQDDEAAKAEAELEAELLEMEDDFMKEYRAKRLQEMKNIFQTNVPRFGKVISVTKEQFIKEVDDEKCGVTVCVHIYEERSSACDAMDRCLACLAQQHPEVKFCKMSASDASVSRKFAVEAVPALLIYKNGELIGNFIRLSDEFGEDFFASDVESFLIEHGMLADKGVLGPSVGVSSVRSAVQASDTDSDYDVD